MPVLEGGKFAGGATARGPRTSRAGGLEGGRGSFFRGTSDGLWDDDDDDGVPDDVAIAWEKLRRGFDKAGGRIRTELGHVAHRMHLERLGGHAAEGGELGVAFGYFFFRWLFNPPLVRPSLLPPTADTAPFVRSIRALGGGFETAFRDPAAAFAMARERALRLGVGVREGVRRLAAATAHHGLPVPDALTRRRHYNRSELDEDAAGDDDGGGAPAATSRTLPPPPASGSATPRLPAAYTSSPRHTPAVARAQSSDFDPRIAPAFGQDAPLPDSTRTLTESDAAAWGGEVTGALDAAGRGDVPVESAMREMPAGVHADSAQTEASGPTSLAGSANGGPVV